MSEKKKKTAQPKPPSSRNLPEERGNETGVVILNILLAIVTVALLGYIAYRNGYIDLDNILNTTTEEQVTETETEDDDEIPLALETYEGIHFNAVLPTGWLITEYYDGDGTTMMDTGASYTGLTGIKIENEGEEIMTIEGVSGIGFVDCQELPRFEDSSQEYEQMQEELNQEIGAEEIVYIDFTDTFYSEFEWLGRRFRRIETALYYDTIDEDGEFFQPQCEVSFIRLEALGFEDEEGFEGDTYMYTISLDATEQELLLLDQILTSFTAR